MLQVSAALSESTTDMLNLSGVAGEALVRLNNDLIDSKLSPQDVEAQIKLYQAKAITLDTLYYNLQRGELTRPGVEVEEEREEIETPAGAEEAGE